MAENKGKKPAGQNAGKNKSAAACKRTVQGTKAARTAPPPKPPAAERQGIIKRLIETLKRVIGHKKGERDEFRYNHNEKHPGYVYKEKNGKFKSFGVTHSETTFGNKNMPLNDNPQEGDKRKAYIRTGTVTGKKKNFGGRMKNFKLSPKDKANVKSKKRNAKKIEKEKKRKNK